MARLNPKEREEMLRFARHALRVHPPALMLSFADYLRAISSQPLAIPNQKKIRFQGQFWKL